MLNVRLLTDILTPARSTWPAAGDRQPVHGCPRCHIRLALATPQTRLEADFSVIYTRYQNTSHMMTASGASQEGGRSNEPLERYSVFSGTEKWCITALVAYAAWFSTLSSFIYFPALSQLADYFSVSAGEINLTITSYMAVATVAPMLIGDAADVLGRRPIYVLALGMYVVANVAIASSKSYASLLGLRVLQALAISGTFSVAYGVITDIASPAERGSYVSAVSFAITIAPSIGPVLGGGIAFSAGWAWIFWFLAIASGACLVLMIFFLPETSRNIVGNGSKKPPVYLVLPISRAMRHWKTDDGPGYQKIQAPNPLKSLVILFRKDNATIILACGLLYAVYTCINASLSTLFIEIYRLNQWQAGLVYLPFGLGGTLSTFISGPLLDRAYRKARTSRGLLTDRARGDDLDKFPVEKARLGVIWVPMAMTICSVIAFGWVLDLQKVRPINNSGTLPSAVWHFPLRPGSSAISPVDISCYQHPATPLCLQFIAGLCMQLDFSVSQHCPSSSGKSEI